MTDALPAMSDVQQGVAFSPAKMPVLELVRQVYDLSPDEVLKQAIEISPLVDRYQWTLAFLVYRVEEERLYSPRYGSMVEWAREALSKSSATISKYKQAAEFCLSAQAPDEREQIMRTAPQTLAESGVHRLAKKDRAEAVRLAASGMSKHELTQAVRARQADEQHYDTEELRTFRIVMREEQYRSLKGLWNWVLFQCQTPHPSDPEVVDLIRGDVGDLIEEYWDRQGLDEDRERERCFPWRQIIAGKVHCAECRATNGNDLQGHHVIPRSHKGRDDVGRFDGTDGPVVWLCIKHHQRVTENWGGTWRTYLKRWMGRKDLKWLKADIEEFLQGRSLEEV